MRIIRKITTFLYFLNHPMREKTNLQAVICDSLVSLVSALGLGSFSVVSPYNVSPDDNRMNE